MSIDAIEGFGFFYNGLFQGVATPAPGPDPDPPSEFRVQDPWQYPFHENSFWNTPVGDGAEYVPTNDVRHTQTLSGTSISLNSSNWTDAFYLATDSDPMLEVEMRSQNPTGWQNLTNTQTGPTTGQGVLQARYTGVRIPTDARWQSTTNTDRKVIVIQPEVTLRRYNANNELISTQTFPAGTLSIEMHNFYRVTGGEKILCTNLSWCDLRGYGMGYGALASGVSMSQGYVRKWEVDAALAGDHTAIRHALKCGIPNSKLKVGQVWPASHQDGNAATAYTGQTPMGSMFVLHRDVNIDTISYTGSQSAQRLQKAFAWTLQNFGAYVLIRAGGGPVVFGIEATPPHYSSSMVEEVRVGLQALIAPQLRIVANSADVGTLHNGGTLHRTPVDISRIAGGGARNEALRPLPIDPAGPWV